MSAGVSQQLSALGAQDAYLSISPQVSFWKRGYKRVANYAIEASQHGIVSAAWDKELVTMLNRNGDLMTDLWLVLDINTCRLADSNGDKDYVRWVNTLGHAAIRDITFELGGAEIDKTNGTIMEIKHELESDSNRDTDELVLRASNEQQLINWTHDGNTLSVDGAPVTQLYIKVPFYFSKARSQAFPLIACQYHTVGVRLRLRRKSDLLNFSNESNRALDAMHNGEIRTANYMSHYVYLDSFERKMFVTNQHEYLIQNNQISNFHTKPSGARRMNVAISFNHPITTLYWYVQKKSHVDNLDYFNFSRTDNRGDDTITSACIKFNGSERERQNTALYFRSVIGSEYFPRTTRKPIYMFSFAASPTSHAPSGSCNFSRLDQVALEFTLPGTDGKGDPFGEAECTVIAFNHNVILLQGGMCVRRYAA